MKKERKNKMAIRFAFMFIVIVASVVSIGFYKSYVDQKLLNVFMMEKLLKTSEDKDWLQNRLADCTECNLAHYYIIQDCWSCKRIASKKDGMSELYWKLN